MKYRVPGDAEIELDTIILDLNGTLTVGGVLVNGVVPRIASLKKMGFSIYLFSGDTRGNGRQIAFLLDIQFIQTSNGQEKYAQLQKLDATKTVSIGNGLIDLDIISHSKIGIVVLQSEGVHTKTLLASDIVVPSITDALDLLLDENRFIATIRK